MQVAGSDSGFSQARQHAWSAVHLHLKLPLSTFAFAAMRTPAMTIHLFVTLSVLYVSGAVHLQGGNGSPVLCSCTRQRRLGCQWGATSSSSSWKQWRRCNLAGSSTVENPLFVAGLWLVTMNSCVCTCTASEDLEAACCTGLVIDTMATDLVLSINDMRCDMASCMAAAYGGRPVVSVDRATSLTSHVA